MSKTPSQAHQKTPEQKRGIRKTVAILVVIVSAVIALQVYNVTREPPLDRERLREQGTIIFEQPRQISEFELLDHNEQAFTPESLEGQWSLIFFGFTHCPDICPMAMVDLARVMTALPPELAENTQVLLVTLDPARDEPEVLAEYVPHFHPDFLGVTGEFLTIRRMANEFNVAFSKVTLEDDDYTVDHSGHIALVNPRGHYHGFFRPPFDPERMAEHYGTVANALQF